jgi:urease accessory protein
MADQRASSARSSKRASEVVNFARVTAGVAVGALVSNPAQAHMGTGLAGGFLSGFVHPFHGLDHLLAMISVGLWGAFLGRPLIYVLPVTFPAMMAAGAIMGMFSAPMLPVEVGIASSVLLLGGCIALSVRAPVWTASLIVAIFAIFHGYTHGEELPSAADPVSYTAGFVVATGLLHVSGIGLGSLNRYATGIVAIRILGATIALVGGSLLWRAYGA